MRQTTSAVALLVLLALVLATVPCARPEPTAATAGNSITSPDTAGSWTSLALDASGNPVVSYHDESNFDLKVLRCGNPNCTSGNSITSPDTGGHVGRHTSLVLDSSSNPVVSYYDSTNGSLKVLHCGNPKCTSGNSITSPDTGDDVGAWNSLVLDGLGNPVVSYRRGWPNSDLMVMHCNDPNCAGGDESITSPDTGGDVGWFTSLALDASGNPVVSYWDFTTADLKVLHCGNPNCTSGNSITSPDTGGEVGEWNSLALDGLGNPVVSYWDHTNDDLKVLHCGDPNCTSDNSITSPDTGGEVGKYTSLVLDSSSNPVVSYFDHTLLDNGDLRVMHCNDPNCAGGDESITSPDTGGEVGLDTSLELDTLGNPVVSYQDWDNWELKVLHCGDPNCTGAPQPAVLVMHGWQLPWQGANCGSMEALRTYIRDGLGVDDSRVQCFGYDPDKGVRQTANELKREVEQFKKELGASSPSKIHLVAHSFGGLVSRYYVEQLDKASQVASLIMLGTPNRGVWAADLPTMLCLMMPPSTLKAIVCGGTILYYLFDRAAYDMRPGSAILSSLNDGFSQPPTEYQVIAGTADGPLGWVLYLNAPNDCVVSVDSAQGPGLPTTTDDVIHTDLPSWLCSDTSNLLDDSSVFADVLAVIQSASGDGSSSAQGTFAGASEDEGEELTTAGLVFDTVGPGEIGEHTTSVEGASQTGFALFWLASDTVVPELRLTLETPGEIVIDASGPGVTYNPAAGPGFGGMMAESYMVETPEVGEWILRVEAVDVPAEGLSYALVVSRDSPIAITPALDEGSYLVGQPILTIVAVTDDGAPVTDATVSALASTPSGDVPLSLHDDGFDGDTIAEDGIYSALLNDTSVCGLYQFHLTAMGTGGSFVREAVLLADVRVMSDAAGDPCLADDDGDDFDDETELYVATDPLDACPDDSTHDAWPLDINMDTYVTVGGDVLPYRGRIGATGGPPPDADWLQRLDINMDNFITVGGDVLPFRGMIGESCT